MSAQFTDEALRAVAEALRAQDAGRDVAAGIDPKDRARIVRLLEDAKKYGVFEEAVRIGREASVRGTGVSREEIRERLLAVERKREEDARRVAEARQRDHEHRERQERRDRELEADDRRRREDAFRRAEERKAMRGVEVAVSPRARKIRL